MKHAYNPPAAAIRTVLAVPILLLLAASLSSANVCVQEKLKPLRHIAGVVLDADDKPIPNAKVQVLMGGKELSAVRTGENGKFLFGPLAAGKYELRAEAPGFQTAGLQISVVRPQASAKRVLLIHLEVGGAGCPQARIIKARPPF
jgi:hypothetical protein